jgi:hypothetical protein
MVGRLFNRYKYTSIYHPTHEGIHESLLKYAEEHAGESLEHLKLKLLKETKKNDNNQDKKP